MSLFRPIRKQNSPTDSPSKHAEAAEIEDIDVKENISELLKGIDLFVVSGAQHMSDAVKDAALRTLERLAVAAQLGVPIVMVGQGVGPIHDPDLFRRAKQVLPLVDLIFVREIQSSIPLLKSLDVDSERIVFTGDDAVELGYRARKSFFGSGIGLSVRITEYTQMDKNHLESIKRVLSQKSKLYDAPLLALPMSFSWLELDDVVFERLSLDVKPRLSRLHRLGTPLETIHNVSRCRLVITGTFHAAIFALSQGIPVIGLAKSEMYIGKFRGLADQFAEGCQVLYLEDPEFSAKLADAIDEAWASAAQVRPGLLRVAEEQSGMGNAAYKRIHEIVEFGREHALERS